MEEVKIVNVPAFAESVSEGDVRWEKGKTILTCYLFPIGPVSLMFHQGWTVAHIAPR